MKPLYTQPALVGALVGGILSALPIIKAGNLCCCLWVISGGLVAAYVLQQNQATPIAQSDGALVGLLAGAGGAFVYSIVSIPIDLLMAPLQRELLQRFMETMGNMPPQFQEYARSSVAGSARAVLGFIFMLCVGVVFSTLGGLLGAVIFARKPAPATSGTPSQP